MNLFYVVICTSGGINVSFIFEEQNFARPYITRKLLPVFKVWTDTSVKQGEGGARDFLLGSMYRTTCTNQAFCLTDTGLPGVAAAGASSFAYLTSSPLISRLRT